MREEALRAALRASARQADSRREPLRQEPMRQEPVHQKPVPVDALPSEVRVVGRSPQPAKPIRSVKSGIVPEPDQVQSKPTRVDRPEH
jgi:hypothetical protein